MKKKKLKKVARAQMERMGGGASYVAALRIVDRGTGGGSGGGGIPLEATIATLIRLAEAARGNRAVSGPGNLSAEQLDLAPTNPQAALAAALHGLSLDDVHRVETVMNAGRDLGDRVTKGRYYLMHETLSRVDADLTSMRIEEKLLRLAEYLRRGLELARLLGISLNDLSPVGCPSPVNRVAPSRSSSSQANPSKMTEWFDETKFRVEANAAWLAGLRRATGADTLVSRTWTDLGEMVDVLKAVGKPNTNYMFFPRSGGNDVTDAKLALAEADCIEIFCGGGTMPELLCPHSLTLNVFSECPSMSYLRIDLRKLAPTRAVARHSEARDEVVEISPGRYEDRALWDDGDREPSWRLVTRWLEGAFVIFSKGSLYNSFSDYWKGDTADGRHARMDALMFRSFVERIVANAIARGLPTG